METSTIIISVVIFLAIIGGGVGAYFYFTSQKKETFEDSQKDSRKMCSQADINNAYNLYVFGDTTKTKI